MPELHIVASLQLTPSLPGEGELDGFGEAEVCILVEVAEVGVAPELGDQFAPAAAYFVLTRPVSSHCTFLITSFLLVPGLPWMFEKASIMMSM